MAELSKDAKLPGWIRGEDPSGTPQREIQPPILGSAAPLDQEVQRIPGKVAEVHILDLSDKESFARYNELLNKVGSSPFSRVSYVERHWIESVHNWKVLIEIEHQVRVEIPFSNDRVVFNG